MVNHGRAVLAATLLLSCAALSDRASSHDHRAGSIAGPIVIVFAGGALLGIGRAASRQSLDA